MYSIRNYGEMIRDAPRMEAYVHALRQTVGPGAVVADIGTGTGIFALVACRLGARKVFAVEPSDAIDLAREIAAANGYTDRIEFFKAASTQVTFPEPADVIVSDLRGILPLFGRHLEAVRDARARLLAPGGRMVPECDTLWCAVVEEPEAHARITGPWLDNEFGLDLSAGARVLANAFYKIAPAAEALVTPPACVGDLDYRHRDALDFSATVTLTAARPATAHGICMWFDSTLATGVSLSNAPGAAPLIYGNAFFPWPEAVQLEPGDTVGLAIRADFVGDDYVWTWRSRIASRGEHSTRRTFDQSEFFGELLSRAQLAKRGASHAPGLGDAGQAQLFVLNEMARGAALSEIARRALEHFPARFRREEDALAYVADMSAAFGAK